MGRETTAFSFAVMAEICNLLSIVIVLLAATIRANCEVRPETAGTKDMAKFMNEYGPRWIYGTKKSRLPCQMDLVLSSNQNGATFQRYYLSTNRLHPNSRRIQKEDLQGEFRRYKRYNEENSPFDAMYVKTQYSTCWHQIEIIDHQIEDKCAKVSVKSFRCVPRAQKFEELQGGEASVAVQYRTKSNSLGQPDTDCLKKLDGYEEEAEPHACQSDFEKLRERLPQT
uniref:Putative secreted protein n=1 Tax=Amblyomma americanum TaxID=6943 RepID=A0A0C9R6K4_AMBAM